MERAQARRNVVSRSELLERCASTAIEGLADATDLDLVALRIRGANVRRRPAGAGAVHVSFRFSVALAGRERQGCLLLPLPEALALAAGFFFQPEELVLRAREHAAPDTTEKEALLELANVVAASLERALSAFVPEVRVTSAGCQGVREGVRPRLVYREGDELWVASIVARLEEYDGFAALLVLPSLTGFAARPATAGERRARAV
jgi:hypothetical protein